MKKVVFCGVIISLFLSGCSSMRGMSREEREGFGANIGSFFGWLFGGLIGESVDGERGGAFGSFIGTAIGGMAGASIAGASAEEPERRQPGKYSPESHVLLPNLLIEDILLEEPVSTRNNKIDAGENCRISFVIVNNSHQEALKVEPIVTIDKGKSYLKLSKPNRIDRISREDRVFYHVTVKASPELPVGKAIFRIRLKEARGNGTESETFTIETVGK